MFISVVGDHFSQVGGAEAEISECSEGAKDRNAGLECESRREGCEGRYVLEERGMRGYR